MTISSLETHGRKLLVEFKCQRCGTTATRPLENCINEMEEPHRDLYYLRPPTGWQNGGFYYPLFCPQCKEDYRKFMTGKGGVE